ncbi:MAG: twin-arginine translocase TatA/TatE family subunit [Alphaproteobacteria bacterium]|nr:twin-arginine translocase TatA/TatE family subunit [Alphaproteobacteria bacterium]
MFNLGWPEILIIALIVVILFGRGKISGAMGDVAKGIKNFKKGLAEDDDETASSGSGQEGRRLERDSSLTDVTPRKDDAAKS